MENIARRRDKVNAFNILFLMNLSERDHLEDLGVDMITLILII
jgi:hypothetical protein